MSFKLVRHGLFDWESEAPCLIGCRCRICREIYFPSRPICPNCLEEGTLENISLSEKGKLYSFCVVQKAPFGFEAPYAVGYVDLPEGLRIYAILAKAETGELRIGTEVKVVFEKITKDTEGNDILGYKFVPIS